MPTRRSRSPFRLQALAARLSPRVYDPLPITSVPIIYSRTFSVVSAVLWTLAWAPLLIGYSALLLNVLLPSTRVVGFLAIALWWLTCLLIASLDPASRIIVGKRRADQMTPPRPTAIDAVVSGASLGLMMIIIAGGYRWDEADFGEWASWLVTLLILSLGAIVTGVAIWCVQLHLNVGRRIWSNLRGWRKTPFQDWSRADHAQVTTPDVWNTRFPDPVSSEMPRHIARTHAAWCAQTADQRWLLGQVLTVLGGAIAGTAISGLLVRSGQEIAMLALSVGLTLATGGQRIALVGRSKWRARARAYRRAGGD